MSTTPLPAPEPEAVSGIKQAVAAAGGTHVALSKVLGVSEQVVGQWVFRGYVPPARAVEIEKLYGIDRRLLIKDSLVKALYSD